MASENESSIKFTAKADIAEVVQYTQALDDHTAAVHRYAQALEHLRQKGGTVAPGTMPGTGGAGVGAPPPPPVATGTGPAPQGLGQPPPPPHQVEHEQPLDDPAPGFSPEMMRMAAQRAAMPATGPEPAVGAPPPPPAPVWQRAGWAAGRGANRAVNWAVGGAGGGAQRGASFLSRTASTATGVALGTSLTGFFLAAPQRYMALSRVLEQVSNRFREAEGNAATFGQTLGYTIAQGGQLAETLGAATNTVSEQQFQRYTGFARFTGMDPGAAMRGLGGLERVMGRQVSEQGLAGLFMTARERGMGQGLMGEFMDQTAQLAQMQMAATGRVDEFTPQALGGLPAMVFGEGDPRRRGGLGLIRGLQQTMTGGGPMRAFMLRAMGYGKEGGPGFIDAMKRVEAGVFDTENLEDMFGRFEKLGLGRDRKIHTLQEASGGALKWHEAESLVDSLGGEKGSENLARLREMSESGAYKGDARGALMAYLAMEGKGPQWSDEGELLYEGDVAAYKAEGMAGLGKGRVPLGARSDVQLERMMFEMGGPLAQAIPSMRRTLENMFDSFQNLTGIPWGELIPKIATTLEEVSAGIASLTAGQGSDMFRYESRGNLLPGTAVSARQMTVLRQFGPSAMAMGATAFLSGGESGYNVWYDEMTSRMAAKEAGAPDDRAGGGL